MIHWNVDPTIFSLGPLYLRWYGLMFLISFTVGNFIFRWMCKKENKSVDGLDSLLTYVVAGTIIGARLGHCFFYEPQYFLSHPLEIFAIWQGGLASHGGGIGVLVSIWLFTRKYKNFAFFWIVDRAAPLVALAGFFIRIGNLFNSEIIGRPTNVAWAFIFDKVDLIPRHPTQLYESASYVLVSVIGMTNYKFFRYRPPQGLLFGVTLTGIFISRFIWEFFKENQEPFEANMFLNMGQILSIPFVLVGFYFILRSLINQEPNRSISDDNRQ